MIDDAVIVQVFPCEVDDLQDVRAVEFAHVGGERLFGRTSSCDTRGADGLRFAGHDGRLVRHRVVVEQTDGRLGAGGLAGAARVMTATSWREDVGTTTELAIGGCRAAWLAVNKCHVAGMLNAVTEKVLQSRQPLDTHHMTPTPTRLTKGW